MTGFLLRLASQWIAGENAEAGIERVKQANAKGVLGLLNLLGEHVELKDQVEATVEEYLNALYLIEEKKVESNISVKPSQLGLGIDFEYCVANYLKIAEACATHSNNYLWIDMEDSTSTEKTIDLYERVLARYPNTGVAIQSYLRRSKSDLERILPKGGKVRLVKGAYNEPEELAFKRKKEVTSNYAILLETLYAQKERNFFAVATHDSFLVDEAKKLSKIYHSNFEFEMLMGVRNKLKQELVAEGWQVREYVPYGPEWLAYSMRRIREKKSNILLLGRSLFTQ